MCYRKYTWFRDLLWILLVATVAILLTLGICTAVHAAGLTVSTVADQVGVVPGQVVTITSTLTNSYATTPPIELTATASYSVGLLPAETVTNKVTLNLTKPVTVPSITLPLGSNFSLIDGSCKLDNVVITTTVADNVLTIPVTKTLTEGQTAKLSFQLRCQ